MQNPFAQVCGHGYLSRRIRWHSQGSVAACRASRLPGSAVVWSLCARQGRASLACALVRVRPLLRDEATHLHFGVRLPLPHLAAGYGSIMLADVRGVVDATAMSLQKPLHKLRLKRANAAHTILAASSGEKHSLWNASACKRRKVADARRRSESPMLHLSFVQRVRCPSTGFIATSPSVTGSCTQICEQNLAGLATACGVLVSNRIAERPHAVHS